MDLALSFTSARVAILCVVVGQFIPIETFRGISFTQSCRRRGRETRSRPPNLRWAKDKWATETARESLFLLFNIIISGHLFRGTGISIINKALSCAPRPVHHHPILCEMCDLLGHTISSTAITHRRGCSGVANGWPKIN